jgi:uncharacterized protein YbaR (Trm112 family)
MRSETLEVLCSPLEHAALRLTTDVSPDGETWRFLTNDEHRLRFPVRNGIPVFVEGHQITGINSRFRTIYDGCAPFYDLLSRVGLMDETEKVARILEKIPGINAWFNHRQRPIIPPVKLVPEGMEEVQFRELYDGLAWYLSFRKPLQPTPQNGLCAAMRERS